MGKPITLAEVDPDVDPDVGPSVQPGRPWRRAQPRLNLRKPDRGDPPPPGQPEVGEFRQGTALSQAALARYLVGRALAESVGAALLIVGVAVLALAAVAEWVGHSTLIAVLLVLIALFVLLMRWAVLAVVRRLTGFARFGPLEGRMRALVHDTRSDVLRELRRLGLPGRVWTLPLLATRLLSRRRRPDTLARVRRFDVSRAVPRSRLDELHLVMTSAFREGMPPEPGPPRR